LTAALLATAISPPFAAALLATTGPTLATALLTATLATALLTATLAATLTLGPALFDEFSHFCFFVVVEYAVMIGVKPFYHPLAAGFSLLVTHPASALTAAALAIHTTAPALASTLASTLGATRGLPGSALRIIATTAGAISSRALAINTSTRQSCQG